MDNLKLEDDGGEKLNWEDVCLWAKNLQMNFIRDAHIDDPLTKLVMFLLLSKIDKLNSNGDGTWSISELVKATGSQEWAVRVSIGWLVTNGYLKIRHKRPKRLDFEEFRFDIDSHRFRNYRRAVTEAILATRRDEGQ